MILLRPLEAPVDPVEALRRIAVLLERSRAGSYRIEAFRKAARVVAALDGDELAERATAGTLTELAGVGDATASVVAQAVAGEVPSYLESLQEKGAGPLVRGGGGPVRRRSSATCTATRTGATAAARSTRSSSPRSSWARTGWP